MRQIGIAVVVGTIALSGLMLLVWLLGLVFGFGGGLIHLLLLLAFLIAPAGVVAGVVLIILAGRQTERR